jgi:hypothetical protein
MKIPEKEGMQDNDPTELYSKLSDSYHGFKNIESLTFP